MEFDFKMEDGVLTKYQGSDGLVVIPDGVTEIGENAFKGNKTLTEVTMPDSVTRIGKYAFHRCAKLKTVVFSKRLTDIEYEAFAGCRSLRELSLPDTLKTVGSGAFGGCVKLAKVSCDSKVYEIGSNPFSAFQEAECKLLFDENGFLVFANVLYQYNRNDDVIVVPDGVTHIAGGVFRSGTHRWERELDVKKVILPESVRYVGRYAFADCAKLEEIVMPEGITIDQKAFGGCIRLARENGMIIIGNTLHAYLGQDTEIAIPEGVEVLADNLFSAAEYGANAANRKITKIVLPEGLKHIGNCTFRGCSSLQEINIPDSVEKIDAGAFFDCVSLKTIQVPKTAKVFNQAFQKCRGLTDENGFIIINDFLFQYLGTAGEIVVPENVKLIGHDAFSGSRIRKIKLPGGLVGLGSAFEGCEWLEEIDIPEGITEIHPQTFKSCLGLTKVRIPGTVTKIGKSAFENCEALAEIHIPEGVTQIGDHAFSGCKALKTIEFPAGVKHIPACVCYRCEGLETVAFSDGVEVIERGAFANCGRLERLALPQSVQEIGIASFEGCLQLEALEILNPGCDIDLTAFKNCPKQIDENGMKIIAGVLVEYTGKGGSVSVPDTVHTIAPNAFREGSEYAFKHYVAYRPEGSLQEIVIPGSVKSIGANAFKGCKKLSKVTLCDGLEGIDSETFASCEMLGELALPSTVRYVGNKAFYECTALTSVVIPKNLDAIGMDAFRACKKLTDIFVEPGSRVYADVEGILYNAEKTGLIYCPGGKRLKEFTVPGNVSSVEDHAFIDCESLKKVVIPACVKEIGSEVFPRVYWSRTAALKDIQIAFGAGETSVGEAVIDFPYGEEPLVYPTIPVLFPKEQTTQVRLGLGFCLSPEKYSGEYAESYRKYAKSHQKTLLKKAEQLKLSAIEAYFNETEADKTGKNSGYKPNLTLKKPNELQKVEILEETVLKGTLEDLVAVLSTYKTFELTARALALASRYRGVEFVRVLAEHGATFDYTSTSTLQRKYSMDQKTAAGAYSTEYYLIVIPETLDLAEKIGSLAYEYSPLCGIHYMNIPEELEAARLPLPDRLEVVRFLAENKKLGASPDEMLFWALVMGEIELADMLIGMDVDLGTTPPAYYTSWDEVPTYLDTVTSGSQSVYWTSYMTQMCQLKAENLLPVLERFDKLAKSAGKSLTLTQKLFEQLAWNDTSLAFAIENIDLSKINQKNALENAVNRNAVDALTKMAEAGWLAQSTKREKLIEFARENGKHEALAWLLEFKNRTVDVAAEEARAQEKMIRELTESPDSVSALKKIWTYKKLDDGTLRINGYKGSDTEVVVPDKIGKAKVSTIGEYAFGISSWSKIPANAEARKRITSVVLPEGVTEIETAAFYGCESLSRVSLPSTLKTIGSVAFRNCKELTSVAIPVGTKNIAHGVFWGCDKLYTGKFLIVNQILFHYSGDDEVVEIPEGVAKIADMALKTSGFVQSKLKRVILPGTVEVIGKEAFASTGLETLELPPSVKYIGENAFSKCKELKEIRLQEGLISIGDSAFSGTAIRDILIPETVTDLGKEVFAGCHALRDISVPAGVETIGERCFGWSAGGKFIHTTEGAFVVRFLAEKHPDAVMFYDYGKEDYRK